MYKNSMGMGPIGQGHWMRTPNHAVFKAKADFTHSLQWKRVGISEGYKWCQNVKGQGGLRSLEFNRGKGCHLYAKEGST